MKTINVHGEFYYNLSIRLRDIVYVSFIFRPEGIYEVEEVHLPGSINILNKVYANMHIES